VFWFLDPCY
jgi:hypothetical protein